MSNEEFWKIRQKSYERSMQKLELENKSLNDVAKKTLEDLESLTQDYVNFKRIAEQTQKEKDIELETLRNSQNSLTPENYELEKYLTKTKINELEQEANHLKETLENKETIYNLVQAENRRLNNEIKKLIEDLNITLEKELPQTLAGRLSNVIYNN